MADPLLTPILDTNNPTVHFFEGRLLSARDLREQQTANRTRREMLGRAIGTGIIEGLEVNTALNGSPEVSPVVQVSAGVAINPLGQLLILSEGQNLTLSEVAENSANDAGLFNACEPGTSSSVFVGFGVYVLVMSPVSGYSEFAPKIELGDEGVAKGCGRRYALEGIQFRLVELPLQNYPDISAAQAELDSASTNTTQLQVLSRLRSIVAHAFLHSASSAQHRASLQADSAAVFATSGGALDQLVELEMLNECDVPLAVLFWDTDSLRFVDNWAARRMARWILQPDNLSLFPASGMERLLQFQSHVAQLSIDITGPSAADVEDYFRYLPPAGYVPVQGSGTSAGFNANGFMESFFDRSAGILSGGQFTRMLNESFAFDSMDLDDEPYLQVFSVRQNTEAVSAGNATQLLRAFATRELNGPSIDDGVAAVFKDAWDAYRTLIRRRDFIPFSGSASARAASFAIEAAIRDVMDVANRVASSASAGGLDVDGAWGAFDELYDAQNELIDIFLTGIPTFGSSLGRDTFTTRLQVLVEGNLPVGEPGLNGALAGRVLHDIRAAQQGINDYVREWQAGGTGPFGFAFLDAPGGVNLEPGSLAVRRFTFTNGRSETLRFRLRGEVAAPSGSWGSVTLRDPSGQVLNNVNVRAGESRVVSARFTTPSDAIVGETATLTLDAEIRSTGEIVQTSDDILIAADTGGPLTRSVSFSGEPQVPANTIDIAPGSLLTFGFPVRYVITDTPPTNQEFDFTLTFENDDFDDQWQVAIDGTDLITPSPANVFTRRVTLENEVDRQINVLVRASSNAGAVGEFAVTIRSSGVTPDFGDALGALFTVVVTDGP